MILGIALVVLLAILAFGALVAYVTFWILVIAAGSFFFLCALVVRGFMAGSDTGDYRVMLVGLIGLAIAGLIAWFVADHQRKEEIRKAEEAARIAREEAARKLRVAERLQRQAQEGPLKRWLRGLFD